MPAKVAAKTARKTAKKQVKPKARQRKGTKLASAKVSASTRTKAKLKKPARAKTTQTKEISRVQARAPVRRLTAAERAEANKSREMLLSEHARLLAELQEIGARTARTTDAERATELSSYEDHPADLASETFEREKDLAIAESVESLLNQVNTALEKVERGTYGICDACGRPIKKARLRALPFATLCLSCQGRIEG